MTFKKMAIAGTMAAATATMALSVATAADGPFGGKDDIAFAQTLWATLMSERLVGPNRIHVQPFEGNEPHGAIQQVLGTDISINGRTAKAIVKVNHGGPDVDVRAVYDNPNQFVGAYTVMFKREDGYDPENKNWFWAKYKPTGELDLSPKGAAIAGRFMKGADVGCIACHTAIGGADLETLTSK